MHRVGVGFFLVASLVSGGCRDRDCEGALTEGQQAIDKDDSARAVASLKGIERSCLGGRFLRAQSSIQGFVADMKELEGIQADRARARERRDALAQLKQALTVGIDDSGSRTICTQEATNAIMRITTLSLDRERRQDAHRPRSRGERDLWDATSRTRACLSSCKSYDCVKAQEVIESVGANLNEAFTQFDHEENAIRNRKKIHQLVQTSDP